MQKQASFSDYEIFLDSLKYDDKNPINYDQKPIALPVSSANSLHYHNRIEIGICCEGTGVFYDSVRCEIINKGDIVFFFPGNAHYSHSLHSSSPCRCRFAFIDFLPLLFSIYKESTANINLFSAAQTYNIPIVIRSTEYSDIHLILSRLLEDIFNNSNDLTLLAGIHLTELLIKIPLHFPKLTSSSQLTSNSFNDPICRVETFISSHYNENISINRLCEICNLSDSQLRRKFKKQFGTSPIAYLHKLRCHMSTRLLIHTDLSVLEIAQKIGYLDASEFYKHFHSFFNISPTTFRKKHAK